jgi:hypothetical protein
MEGLKKAGVITERNSATTENSFFIGKLKQFRRGEVYARLLVYRRKTTECERALLRDFNGSRISVRSHRTGYSHSGLIRFQFCWRWPALKPQAQ